MARLSETTSFISGPARKRPIPMKRRLHTVSISRPFHEARRASGPFFSPRRRLSRLLIPVPIPVERAIISIWKGKARETAVSPFGSKRETKMLSTIL